MSPHRPADRDNGMRRISSTTRWLAGAGVALVAAFSLFFADRAASSAGTSTPSVDTPAVTAPAVNGDAGSGSASGSARPVQTAPPVTAPPQHHTRSGGS